TAYRDQLMGFLASPHGDLAFGAGTPIAQRAIARLDSSWRHSGALVGVSWSPELRRAYEAGLVEHPIEGVPFTRPPVVTALAKLMSVQGSGIGAAVGGMQESMARLELRVSLADEFAAKQVGWWTRLALLDAAASPDAADVRGTLHSTRGLVEDTPD